MGRPRRGRVLKPRIATTRQNGQMISPRLSKSNAEEARAEGNVRGHRRSPFRSGEWDLGRTPLLNTTSSFKKEAETKGGHSRLSLWEGLKPSPSLTVTKPQASDHTGALLFASVIARICGKRSLVSEIGDQTNCNPKPSYTPKILRPSP